MPNFTLRDLEFLASLKHCWSRLYGNELARLLRELDEPYLLRPRAPPRRRVSGPPAVNPRSEFRH